MSYHRMDRIISTARFVTRKAKSFAMSFIPGFIMISVLRLTMEPEGDGFCPEVRRLW